MYFFCYDPSLWKYYWMLKFSQKSVFAEYFSNLHQSIAPCMLLLNRMISMSPPLVFHSDLLTDCPHILSFLLTSSMLFSNLLYNEMLYAKPEICNNASQHFPSVSLNKASAHTWVRVWTFLWCEAVLPGPWWAQTLQPGRRTKAGICEHEATCFYNEFFLVWFKL